MKFSWLTLDNYRRAMTPLILRSFSNTIRLSATTAAIGVVLGTLISHALVNTRNRYAHNSVYGSWLMLRPILVVRRLHLPLSLPLDPLA